MPEKERAPLALPSQQRIRIYQEVNNLRLIGDSLSEAPLTPAQRDQIVQALETKPKVTFAQIKKLLGFSGQFNLEDDKRTELKGNDSSTTLSKKEHFGATWAGMAAAQQDRIVMQRLTEVQWFIT